MRKRSSSTIKFNLLNRQLRAIDNHINPKSLREKREETNSLFLETKNRNAKMRNVRVCFFLAFIFSMNEH